MGLTEKLTAIGDAIRGKTGSTALLTLDQMATEIAGIETGGGSAMYSGSFIPAENLLETTIDIGGAFTHFVLQSATIISNPGVKYTNMVCVNGETNRGSALTSNNAGSASGGFDLTYADNGMYKAPTSGSYIQTNDNSVFIKCGTSGSVLGYLIGGITYNWYAWQGGKA